MIDVSPRIQWIAICAWQYQFEPQYISGKMNVIADTLSRVTQLDFEEHDVDREVLAVNVLTYTAMHSSRMCTNHFTGCLFWGVSTWGVFAWAGGCLPWGVSARGWCVCPGEWCVCPGEAVCHTSFPVDRQTPVKILPCPELRLWAVKIELFFVGPFQRRGGYI